MNTNLEKELMQRALHLGAKLRKTEEQLREAQQCVKIYEKRADYFERKALEALLVLAQMGVTLPD